MGKKKGGKGKASAKAKADDDDDWAFLDQAAAENAEAGKDEAKADEQPSAPADDVEGGSSNDNNAGGADAAAAFLAAQGISEGGGGGGGEFAWNVRVLYGWYYTTQSLPLVSSQTTRKRRRRKRREAAAVAEMTRRRMIRFLQKANLSPNACAFSAKRKNVSAPPRRPSGSASRKSSARNAKRKSEWCPHTSLMLCSTRP